MRLLFITRKFPPMIEGMEQTSYFLSQGFKKKVPTEMITWGYSQKFLPLFITIAFIKSLSIIPRKRIDRIHIGDALLSPLGLFLKYLFRTKTSITIHGLDIIYPFPLYQFIIPMCVSKMDKIICVSKATYDECLKRGVPEKKCVVISWGVDSKKYDGIPNKQALEKILGSPINSHKVMVTVGRLVKRKGVYWFIKHIIPKISPYIFYLVVGEGPEKHRIEQLILKLKLNKRVFLLGKISDETLRTIYNTSDLFIMPNLKKKGNLEGFGIVAIEASSTGLPVIASDIEGIKDAVVNKKNGLLVKELDEKVWVEKIHDILFKHSFSRNSVSLWTKKTYDWNTVTDRYLQAIQYEKNPR